MVTDGENVDIEHQIPGLIRTLFTGPSEEGESLLMDLVLQLDAMVLFTKDSLTVEWWREKLKERGLT